MNRDNFQQIVETAWNIYLCFVILFLLIGAYHTSKRLAADEARIAALETRKVLAPAASHAIPILRVYAGTLKIDSREWGARTLPGFQEAGK